MPEPVLFGSYELLERIGEGGMAEVWRARSRGVAGFEKTVVIKRVLPTLMANPGFADLLIREAKIAALLNHPNIIHIFDLGEEQGAYFIAMEYLAGRDLGAAMTYRAPRDEKPGLTLPLKLWIVAEVAKALDYAHRRRGEDGRPLNIVHRDVSPQNILLGYEGEVKVADFGIARADETDLGRGEDPKVLRGKYAYMSPEQARGEPLDRRSDLFSLGICLYEIVVGKRLFRAKTGKETLERVRTTKRTTIDADQMGVPPELASIIERALAPDRGDRYSSAAAIGADLSALLFDMGENPAEAHLADAMARMFPKDDDSSPNKLRVDLMMRAYDDATALTRPNAGPRTRTDTDHTDRTAAFPVSRKLRAEARRVVVFAVRETTADDREVVEAVVEGVGGLLLPAHDGVHEAVFGHISGGERAAEHAARAALELRRRLRAEAARLSPLPSMLIMRAEARVFDAELVEPKEEAHATIVEALVDGASGTIEVTAELGEDLGRLFVIDAEARELVGYRTRGDREAVALRRRGPLAGRRGEVRALTEAVVSASTGTSGAAFLIVGEPGSGKSRLLAELRAITAPQDVLVVRGRGDPTQGSESFSALADVFRDLCGVEDEDPPAARFEKVSRLRVLGLDSREVRTIGELLGLAYPTAKRERAGRPRGIELTLSARKALRALAQDRAVVLALEDLHWMDDSTRQLLPLLVVGLSKARIVTVMTARLGAFVPTPDVPLLPLRPLARVGGGRLFASCVGARAVEDDLTRRIEDETAGGPVWIEAMAEALSQAGLIEVTDGTGRALTDAPTPITEDMMAAATARLAELRPADRELVRTAAAFPDGVPVSTLCSVRGLPRDVIESGLRRLLLQRLLVGAEADDVSRPSLTAAWSGSGAWGGGHCDVYVPDVVVVPGALLRTAVLSLMDSADRRRLHGAVAAVLEREGAGQDDERISDLAHHAARATDRRRAPDYLVRAAVAARRGGRPALAAKRYAEACELLLADSGDESAERAVELALAGVDCALDAGDTRMATTTLSQVEGLTVVSRTPPLRVQVAIARSRTDARAEGWDAALAAITEVEVLVGEIDDAKLRGAALLSRGVAEAECGRASSAVATLDRAVSTLASAGVPLLHGHALCEYSITLARSGHFDDADDAVASALAITARLGHGELRHRSLAAMGEVHDARGQPSLAAARFREAAEVASQQGGEVTAARLNLCSAVAFLEAELDNEALVLAEEAVRLSRRHRLVAVGNVGSAVQAALAIEAHPDASYIPGIVRAVDKLEGAHRWGDAAVAVQMLARANLALGDSGAAGRSLERAAELAHRAGHVALEERLRARAAVLV